MDTIFTALRDFEKRIANLEKRPMSAIAVNSFRLGTSTAAGYILTANANGYGSWQAPPSGAGDISGSGVAGQIAFFTATKIIAGDSAFIWDNTNKRLGLGITPTVRLDVLGDVRMGGGTTTTLTLVKGTSDNAVRIKSGDTTATDAFFFPDQDVNVGFFINALNAKVLTLGGVAATSGATMKDSSSLEFDAHYYSGGNLARTGVIKHVMNQISPSVLSTVDIWVANQQIFGLRSDKVLIIYPDVQLWRNNTLELRTNSYFTAEGDIIAVGGTFNALRIYTAGYALSFGDGAGTYDTSLYRGAYQQLKTDGGMVVLGDLGVGGSPSYKLHVQGYQIAIQVPDASYGGLVIRKPTVDASNVLFEISHRGDTDKDLLIYGYDGTNYKDFIKFKFDATTPTLRMMGGGGGVIIAQDRDISSGAELEIWGDLFVSAYGALRFADNATPTNWIASLFPSSGMRFDMHQDYPFFIRAVSGAAGYVFRVEDYSGNSLFRVKINGYLELGTDVNLYRSGSNELRTDDYMVIGGDLIVVGGSSWALRVYGQNKGLVLSGASDGAYDSLLYASAADMLCTPDDLKFETATKGVILKDRTTGTFYRLKVDNGTFSIESV